MQHVGSMTNIKSVSGAHLRKERLTRIMIRVRGTRSCLHLLHFVLTWLVARPGDRPGRVQKAKSAKKTQNDRVPRTLIIHQKNLGHRSITTSRYINIHQPRLEIEGVSKL